ncbi:hypothetical protein RCL1_003887 [Eukaryota sp. TZLM3-RCL]
MLAKVLGLTPCSGKLNVPFNLEFAVMFMIRLLDRYVESPFSFIYVASGCNGTVRPDLTWFKWLLSIFPPKYFRNCANFIILHPNFMQKTKILGLKALLMNTEGGRLLSRSHVAKKLGDLSQFVDVHSLTLPSDVTAYDATIR